LTGSTPTTSPSPPLGKATSRHGWPAETPAPTWGTSSGGPTSTSRPRWSSPPSGGTAQPASSTPRPAGSTPADCCTTTPSSPKTASPACTATISQLTLDHVQTSDTQVRLRLSREPVILPAPIDALVRQLVATRRGHATLGDQGTSPWLFPGGQPGRPITALWLADRLRRLGIHARPSRSTALFQLATELPAAVLARMLGIHISVAAAWQRASAGDWTHYAAEISRRHNTNTGVTGENC
jgi:hypothetical protein